MTPPATPRLALLLGDPCGIGPEIVARLLAGKSGRHPPGIVVIADGWLLEWGEQVAGVALDLPHCPAPDALPAQTDGPVLLTGPKFDPTTHTPGRVSPAAGRYALDTLDFAAGLAQSGVVDGICFAPLNKQALHAAGSPHADDLRYFADRLGVQNYAGEINTLDGLWTSRVSSHIPLRAVCDHISIAEILPAIRLIHRTIRRAGVPVPRIAVAGLNPHAGEGGLFGSEEIDVIRPAVEAAQEEDIAAQGPFPPDTVFLRASQGAFDGVVTMYHDQGQIAMKLLGFSRGVTVHGGLPVPITTPAHGTAFDIAGQGKASHRALQEAVTLCGRLIQTVQ